MTEAYYSEGGLSAAYYDHITALDPSVRGDVDIYARLAPPAGAFLELGAGTGRVTLGLAERGFSVLGLDLAPNMLAQAETRRAAAPQAVGRRVRLMRGDMTELERLGLEERFHAVICPFFALAHLPVGPAWERVFAGAAGLLVPGGFAAFHVPSAERLAAAPAPPPGRPLLRLPPNALGLSLSIYVTERSADPQAGRFGQVVDYVLTDARNRVVRRSREQLTYHVADPTPFGVAAGLVPGTPLLPMGETGYIQVFRKPD
jgi:SAM-dependent methyltransferase